MSQEKQPAARAKRLAERPAHVMPDGTDVFRLNAVEKARLERAMRFYYAWRDDKADPWASGAQRSNFPHGDRVLGGSPLHTRGPGRVREEDTSHFLRIEAALYHLLDHEQREMMRWRYVDNLKYRLMADRLNVSLDRFEPWWREATVKMYYAIYPPLTP